MRVKEPDRRPRDARGPQPEGSLIGVPSDRESPAASLSRPRLRGLSGRRNPPLCGPSTALPTGTELGQHRVLQCVTLSSDLGPSFARHVDGLVASRQDLERLLDMAAPVERPSLSEALKIRGIDEV